MCHSFYGNEDKYSGLSYEGYHHAKYCEDLQAERESKEKQEYQHRQKLAKTIPNTNAICKHFLESPCSPYPHTCTLEQGRECDGLPCADVVLIPRAK